MQTLDLIIVGSGPAGCSAAIYAQRQLVDSIVLERDAFGGQPMLTSQIENYPGFASVGGFELMDSMREQATSLGARFENADAKAVKSLDNGLFLVDAGESSYAARSVIWAAGSSPRHAGFVGEEKFVGRGVSYCATCDAMFYRNKQVFVCGGGDSAAEEALLLADFASHVTVLVRKDRMRAQESLVKRLNDAPNVDIRFNTRIRELSGGDLPSTLALEDTRTRNVSVSSFEEGSFGVFVFVGMRPNNAPIEPLVKLDATGHALVDGALRSTVPGLFVAGDCRSKELRQIVTAASDGAIAATSAAAFLKNLKR